MPVFKKGDVWYYRFQIGRKRIARAIPHARTKRLAERAEAAAKQEAYEGKFEPDQSNIKLRHFIENHYLPWAKAEKRSWRNDVSRVKPILAHFGSMRVRDISTFNVRQFRRD